MNTRRILGVAALGAAGLALLAAPAAQADHITYAATSDGRALTLSIFGNELTAGDSHAELASSPSASAEGAGLATPLQPFGSTTAAVDADNTSAGSADETCEGSLPDVPGLTLDLACSSSVASIAGGLPSAAATGRVGNIVANPISIVAGTPLEDVVEQVGGTLQDLVNQLDPLTDPIGDATGLGLSDTLEDVVETLFEGADLAHVVIGDTTAETVVTADALISRCTAEGARIDLLDAPEVAGIDPAPLVSIIVGQASAEISVDSDTAVATPTASPALVRIIAPTLGLDIPVEVGQTIDIPLPDPFHSRIIAADTVTGTTPEGLTFAQSSAVFVDLFNGEALMGGIELGLADCQVAAGANLVPTSTTPASPTTLIPQLPKTGGGAAGSPLAIVGALGFAGLGAVLLRRSRTA